MNDFILTDSQLNPAAAVNLRSPQNVTGLDNPVPYLVTEYAGHMYPTKRHDCEVWQNEHVMRHLKVLDASFANPNISGAIAWCLFDYNTHLFIQRFKYYTCRCLHSKHNLNQKAR